MLHGTMQREARLKTQYVAAMEVESSASEKVQRHRRYIGAHRENREGNVQASKDEFPYSSKASAPMAVYTK